MGALALGILVPAAPALASPKSQIRSKQAQARVAKAQLDQLGRQLEPAIERYNRATLELDQVNTRIALNQRYIGIVERNIERGQRLLARRLVEEYRRGSPDPLATVLAAGSLNEMLAAADLLKRSEHQAADLVATFNADRRELGVRRRELAADRARAQELRRRAAAEKATITAGIARERQLIRGLETEIARLIAAEQARQRRLLAEAKARIEREARARRRALALAAARTADPGIGGSASVAANGGGSSGGSGGDGDPGGGSSSGGSSSGGSSGGGSSGGGSSSGGGRSSEIAAPPPPSNGSLGQRAVAVAMRHLGTPYRWGGESPGGFDCSGLTKYAYGQVGVSLSHYTGAQWNEGARISSMRDLQVGDLVFFHSDLHHMGMYIGGGSMIHAPHTGDVVKISSITSGYYASAFRGGVRPG